MAKKNKQQIKFEADISGLKQGIREGEQSIRSLTKELKLNQEQLKGNRDNADLLTKRIKTLQEQYDRQTKVVEQCNQAYEEAVEQLGENSEEAKKWKDKLVEAETKQQKIKNALDETNKELEKQSSKLITNGKKWQETGDTIVKIGNKINSIGNKLSVISTGTAGLAATALKASIDYESAFAGVRKTVDGTEEQLQSIRQGILDMSTELPSAATEIAAVAEAAGQLGIKTDDILSFTRVMIDLGESTNLSSTEAASSLAKFANVTGMTADNYSRLGSVIVALGNNFATTEADIVSMATRLAATGELTGLTEAQIMALATAMSSVGIEAEAGGSAMSKLLKKIQVAVETGSDELQEFAKIAGMTSEEFQKAFQEDAVSALSSFIAGLNDTERNGKSAIAVLDDMGLTEVRLSNTILSLANSSDVMTKAINLSNKSWKENTALNKEASQRYKTTESQLKMLKNEATKLAIEFGNDLTPSLRQLIRDIKPVLNNISDAIKKFSQLDEKTKKNIISIGAFIVALGPITKTIGGITTATGKTITSIGKLSEAFGNVATGSTSADKSVKALTGVIQGLTSPVGIATMAVTALVGAYAVGQMQIAEMTEETRKLRKEIDQEADARKELIDTVNKQQSATLSEMKNVSSLVGELDKLVDENGKVKDGYKERVNFILTELNRALGTEYKVTGDVIDQYKELKKSVEDLIRAKQIEAIMEAEQEKYNNAIENKSAAYERMKETEQEVLEIQKQIAEWEARNGQIDNSFLGKLKRGFNTQTDDLRQLENLKIKLKETQETFNRANEEYQNYFDDVATGEKNLTVLLGENVDEQNKLIEEKIMAHQTASDDIAESTKVTIDNYLYDLNMYKKYKDEAVKKQDETAAVQYQKQIENNQKNLEEHARSLAAITKTTENMTPAQVEAWKLLANESFDTYAKILSELDDETIRKIQDATGGVVSDDKLAAAFKNLGKEGIEGFKKNNFTAVGQSAAQNIADGMTSKSGLFSRVSEIFSQKLRIIASVSTQGSSSGHADGLAYVPSNNYIARLHEGERVLTKKENQDYTRNHINNNSSVTVNIYPQTMTEQEMIKVSNYIERKWGKRS